MQAGGCPAAPATRAFSVLRTSLQQGVKDKPSSVQNRNYTDRTRNFIHGALYAGHRTSSALAKISFVGQEIHTAAGLGPRGSDFRQEYRPTAVLRANFLHHFRDCPELPWLLPGTQRYSRDRIKVAGQPCPLPARDRSAEIPLAIARRATVRGFSRLFGRRTRLKASGALKQIFQPPARARACRR